METSYFFELKKAVTSPPRNGWKTGKNASWNLRISYTIRRLLLRSRKRGGWWGRLIAYELTEG